MGGSRGELTAGPCACPPRSRRPPPPAALPPRSPLRAPPPASASFSAGFRRCAWRCGGIRRARPAKRTARLLLHNSAHRPVVPRVAGFVSEATRRPHDGTVSLFDPDAAAVAVEFARDPQQRSARTLQRRAATRGNGVVRVRAGAFADEGAWNATSSLERYRARIRAVVRTRSTSPVLCRESAAAVWGIPRIGLWPEDVHLADVARTRPTSRNGVIWHQDRIDASEIVEIDGVFATDLVRTLVDLARTMPFAGAVVALDAGTRPRFEAPGQGVMPGASKQELLTRLDATSSSRGRRAATTSISFCDAASGSVGESLSRTRMHELGFPPPLLQVRMPRPDGPDDIVDFDWPEHRLFGEFDGRGKYVREEFTRGRQIADIVIAEKQREDRIRRRHRPFAVRWDWRVARDSRLLAQCLQEAGLPRSNPRPRRSAT